MHISQSSERARRRGRRGERLSLKGRATARPLDLDVHFKLALSSQISREHFRPNSRIFPGNFLKKYCRRNHHTNGIHAVDTHTAHLIYKCKASVPTPRDVSTVSEYTHTFSCDLCRGYEGMKRPIEAPPRVWYVVPNYPLPFLGMISQSLCCCARC